MATAESAAAFAAHLSQLVGEARRHRGVLKKQIAAASGMRPDELSKLQSGERRPAHRSVVLRLARGLGLGKEAADDLLAAAGFEPVDGVEAHRWELYPPVGATRVLIVGEEVYQPLDLRGSSHNAAAVDPAAGHVVALIAVARLVQEQLTMQLASLGLTYAQAAVLLRLSSSPDPVPIGELLTSMAVSRTSAVLTLTELELRGLTKRILDRSDPDGVAIALTPGGSALQPAILETFGNMDAAITAQLALEQRDIAHDLMNRMLAGVMASGRIATGPSPS